MTLKRLIMAFIFLVIVQLISTVLSVVFQVGIAVHAVYGGAMLLALLAIAWAIRSAYGLVAGAIRQG